MTNIHRTKEELLGDIKNKVALYGPDKALCETVKIMTEVLIDMRDKVETIKYYNQHTQFYEVSIGKETYINKKDLDVVARMNRQLQSAYILDKLEKVRERFPKRGCTSLDIAKLAMLEEVEGIVKVAI
jgi:hypothetical protein